MILSFKTINEMTGQEAFRVKRLRNGVLVNEQKITVPEIDDGDFYVIHVFTLNESRDNALVTHRVLKKKSGAWYLGRVVVSKDTRGIHLGSKMVEGAHHYLKESGVDRLYCHAQMTAKPFYDYLGYQVKGSIFSEADIGHILMYEGLWTEEDLGK